MAGRKRREVSTGTVFMSIFTAVVLAGSLFVLFRLSSGRSADLSRLNLQVLTLKDESGETAKPTATSAAAKASPAAAAHTRATPSPAPEVPENREAVLTFGGTIAAEDGVRRSGYAADTKKYDFSEIFALLKPEVRGSISGAFTENLLTGDAKVSAVVLPPEGAELLTSAGFSYSFSGFGKAWDKGEDGIRATLKSFRAQGIQPLGLVEESEDPGYRIAESGGIRIALMQYTAGVAANTRKTMKRRNADYMIPDADPDRIAADIAAARSDGAQAVVVLLNWGKAGANNPDKSQVILAQRIAESGADLIVGSGSRVTQRMEMLNTADGRQVLCAYSLGTLVSDNRKSAGRMGGILLHVQLKADASGRVSMGEATYTPTYAWKYRQDSKDYYRVLASDRSAPDGMDSEQTKQMQKCLNAVQEALKGSPVSLR